MGLTALTGVATSQKFDKAGLQKQCSRLTPDCLIPTYGLNGSKPVCSSSAVRAGPWFGLASWIEDDSQHFKSLKEKTVKNMG